MKYSLTLILANIIFLTMNAQVRFVEVDYTTNEFALKNFGSTAVDISNYRLCALFVYTTNLSSLNVLSGSLNLTPGNTVELKGFTLAAQSDFGLFLPGSSILDFGDQNFLVDFVEWGSAGNGRESVAVAKGIWGAGDFISTSPPYQHTSSGAQNGVTFWLSIITALPDDIVLNKTEIVIYPNPFEDFAILALNYPFENKGSELLLVFYNLQGREIRIERIVSDKTKIARDNLPNGTYFLVLRGEKEIFATRKIVVN